MTQINRKYPATKSTIVSISSLQGFALRSVSVSIYMKIRNILRNVKP